MNKKIKITILSSYILLGSLTFLSFYLWISKNTKTTSNYNSLSNYQYWDKNNPIILQNTLSNNGIYTDSNRKLEYICDSFNEDTLFYVDNKLITFFDNKYLKDSQKSLLKDNKGKYLYTVYSNTNTKIIIEQEYINVDLYIKDINENIVGYIENKNSYNLFIKNNNKDNIINIQYDFLINTNKVKQIFLNQTQENTLPLSLALGISGLFNPYNKTNQCHIIYIMNFIFSWILLFCFSLFNLILFYKCSKNINLTPRRRISHYV